MTAKRKLVLVSLVLASVTEPAMLGACASEENASIIAPNPAAAVPPAPDAGDAEAGPCTDDCEYFSATCGADVLCPSGLFDPIDPNVGWDWRTRINVIAGRSASDVWLAGAAGAVAHFDGTSWTPSELGTQESQHALWLLDSGEVSFGLVQSIYTRDLDFDAGDGGAVATAGGWSLRPKPPLPASLDGLGGQRVTAASASSGSEALWFAAGDMLWRLRIAPTSELEIVPGAPPAACPVAPCRAIRSLHGASAETLWAVGDLGAAVRITGANAETPTATQLNAQTWTGLSGVWAASDTDVWAVGGAGTIRRYTGNPLRWDIVADVPTNENLNAVWGTSSSDIWAVGDAGVVLHYDGARWSRVKVAGLGSRRPALTAVWSPAAGHVWIGGVGVLLALGGKP